MHSPGGRRLPPRSRMPKGLAGISLLTLMSYSVAARSRRCSALRRRREPILGDWLHPRGRAAVALMVDNIDVGLETLAAKGFTMLTEADLQND